MGKKGARLGNKKSVVLWAFGAYNAGVHTELINIAKGSTSPADALANVSNKIVDNPTSTIGPCAIGYWFWGKPVVGKF